MSWGRRIHPQGLIGLFLYKRGKSFLVVLNQCLGLLLKEVSSCYLGFLEIDAGQEGSHCCISRAAALLGTVIHATCNPYNGFLQAARLFEASLEGQLKG